METEKASPRWHLGLMGGFLLTRNDVQVGLHVSEARVIAYLALRNRARPRRELSGTLWPAVPENRASANLRTTLWRLHRQAGPIIYATQSWLQLAPQVIVDVEADIDDLVHGPYDLLPDWSDEWLIIARERLRQRHLHSAENRAHDLLREGRYAEALDLGLRLIEADPLRESAHRLVITAHLAEGNAVDARRQFAECRRLLVEELGTAPSAQLLELVRGQTWLRAR